MMSATGRGAPAQSATADREIVISRVISAPRELVFEAFTEVRHLSRWWGPEGFTPTTRAFEFRVGGEWDVRAGWDGDPDRDAHGVPHQGTARRGSREVPRDRGRPADPLQTGCGGH